MNTTSQVEIQVIFWNSCVLKHQAADWKPNYESVKQNYKSVCKGINFEPNNKKTVKLFRAANPAETFEYKKTKPWAIFPSSHLEGGEEWKK